MANYELISLNTNVPCLQAPTSEDIGVLVSPRKDPGVYTFQYLTGATQSLYSTTPPSISVGDIVNVSAYNSSSVKCNASWKCTATAASLPASAVAGNVTGTANGALYISNGSGAYYKFEISGSANVLAFGAINDGSGDQVLPMQAAINAARSVFVPYGAYTISSALTLTAGYSSVVGDFRFPFIRILAANGPAIKITASGSSLNEFSTLENVVLYCIGKPPFAITPNSTNCGLAIDGSPASVAAAVQRAAVRNCRILGFSVGINCASTVNTLIESVFIEQHTNWSGEGGYTSSNKYVGVNFDCTPFTPGGISPQASIELVRVVVNAGGAPAAATAMAFYIYGQDPRDIFFDRCESANGNYGYWIQPTDNEWNYDIHIRLPIIDAIANSGIYILDYNGAAAITINDGYVVKNGNNTGAGVWIENSSGVCIGGGFQVIGVASDTTNNDGIRIKGSNACSVVGVNILNCRYGISLDGAENCTIVGNVITAGVNTSEPTPTLADAIRVFDTSVENVISSNTIRGASNTYPYISGITLDTGSINNLVIGNILDPTTVTTPYTLTETANTVVSVSSSSVTVQSATSAVKSVGSGYNVINTNGTGSPEGVVTAGVGSTYGRRDGGAGTSLYVKESGTGNTGWVGK